MFSRTPLVVTGTGALAVMVAASVGFMAQVKVTTTPAQEPDPRIVQLEQRIRDLETRVKALEDEGDFPQDDAAKAGAQPAGRETGSGAAGRGGQTAGSASGSAHRPQRIVAPFEVVDGNGKVLLRVERGPAGGGVVTTMTSSEGVAATLGVGTTGLAGSVRLHKDGKELATLGVAADSGSIILADAIGRLRFQATGGSGAHFFDQSGRERISIAFADDGNRGFVAVRNDKGIEVGNLFESPAGVGSLVTRDGEGQGVQIGTKNRSSGSFGDVCATSPKGGMCLSVLAIKTMNPY